VPVLAGQACSLGRRSDEVGICWTVMLVSERHILQAVLAVCESTGAEVVARVGKFGVWRSNVGSAKDGCGYFYLACLRVGASPPSRAPHQLSLMQAGTTVIAKGTMGRNSARVHVTGVQSHCGSSRLARVTTGLVKQLVVDPNILTSRHAD
jgi:hypothetical protein